MKTTSLIALALTGFTAPLFAQADTPPVEPPKPDATAPADADPAGVHRTHTSVTARTENGKTVIETDVNGKKEVKVIDNDPSKPASVSASSSVKGGKVVVKTIVNGKEETQVFDLDDLDGYLPDLTALPDLNRAFGGADKPAGPVTWLGVATSPVPENVRAQLPLDPDTGLLLESVSKDSPAEKAGLEVHDVLTRVDDQIIIHPQQLATLIANHKDGDTVKLTWLHKGQEKSATATLATHTPDPAENTATVRIGNNDITIHGSAVRPLRTIVKSLDLKPQDIEDLHTQLREQQERMLELLKSEDGGLKDRLKELQEALPDDLEDTIKETVKEALRKALETDGSGH